jgi:hypothetical protein
LIGYESNWQEPGPLGFPHEPQGPAAARGEADVPELERAEKTESCCSSFLL